MKRPFVSAFWRTGLIVKQFFNKLIEVNEKEAMSFLACNAHCPDGKISLKKMRNLCKKVLRTSPVVHTTIHQSF